MSFDEIWNVVVAALREHAVKVATGFALMIIGWYIGKWRARTHWKRQEFLDRLNVSLNTIDSGTLKIRTLSEKRCEEVFLNSVASDTVQKLVQGEQSVLLHQFAFHEGNDRHPASKTGAADLLRLRQPMRSQAIDFRA